MPLMNGIDSTKAIRRHLSQEYSLERSNQPKIIGVTGYDDKSYQKQGLGAGMDKVYVKPLFINDLKEVLKNYYINNQEIIISIG